MKQVLAFTDGSAITKGKCECEKPECPRCNRFGGCGCYYITDGQENFISKGFSYTKTGRMEIMAVLLLLKKIPKTEEKVRVRVYSDSQYVVNSIAYKWIWVWRSNDFEGSANGDLWTKILTEIESRPNMILTINHIKGHQKDIKNDFIFGNNVADVLADYKQFNKRKRDKA